MECASSACAQKQSFWIPKIHYTDLDMKTSDPQAINSSTPKASLAGRVASSTLIVMGGLTASMVIGLVRQRIIAGKFGTSAALDAYTAANGIPELLFTMLAGGALAFAFIPVYTEFLSKGDTRSSNKLASQVMNNIFILATLFSLLLALIAPTLVRAPWGIGPHFSPEIQDLTAQLMRVLFLSTIIFAISSHGGNPFGR